MKLSRVLIFAFCLCLIALFVDVTLLVTFIEKPNVSDKSAACIGAGYKGYVQDFDEGTDYCVDSNNTAQQVLIHNCDWWGHNCEVVLIK